MDAKQRDSPMGRQVVREPDPIEQLRGMAHDFGGGQTGIEADDQRQDPGYDRPVAAGVKKEEPVPALAGRTHRNAAE